MRIENLNNGERKIFLECDVCGQEYPHGHGIYEGRKLAGYDIAVCSSCYGGNWDGWAPDHESRIKDILQKKGISPPPRNAKGWLPREF